MKFNVNRLLIASLLSMITVMFVDSIQKGEIIFSIIFAVFMVLDIIILAFGVYGNNEDDKPISIKITKNK
ncbi:hypothetical protein [Bacillus sp. Bos-x628]|uniref:hypothetical protein n=1 Tax=Bacillus maqinnsis TaxID=3229854 RepID=UPI00338F74E1